MNHTQAKDAPPPWGCLCSGGGILLLAIVIMFGTASQERKEAQENSVDTLVKRYEHNEVKALDLAHRIKDAKTEEERTTAATALLRTMLSPDREKRVAAAEALEFAREGLMLRIGESGYQPWIAKLERENSLAEVVRRGLNDDEYMVRYLISAVFGKPIADQLVVTVTGAPKNGYTSGAIRPNRGFKIAANNEMADLKFEYSDQDGDEPLILVWDTRSFVLLGIAYQNPGLLEGVFFNRPTGRPVYLWVPSASREKVLCDLRPDRAVAPRKVYLHKTGEKPLPAEIFKLVVAPVMGKGIEWVSQPDQADVKVEVDWTTWKAGEWVRVRDNVVVADALKAGLTIQLVNPKTNVTSQTLKTDGWWSTSKETRQTDDDPNSFAKRVNEGFIVNLVAAIYATR